MVVFSERCVGLCLGISLYATVTLHCAYLTDVHLLFILNVSLDWERGEETWGLQQGRPSLAYPLGRLFSGT